MKYFSLTISLFLYCLTTLAQKQNVYFLKNGGTSLPGKDSADYIRIVREPDKGSKLYNVFEFFPSGEKKMYAKSSTIEPITLEGACTKFYKNGTRKQVAVFKQGKQVGAAYDYFPGGKLYTVKYYSPIDSVDTHHKPVPQIVNIQICNDSTGKALVTNGNGHYIGYDDDYKYIDEEGDVKNGYKVDEWHGTAENKKISFIEIYKAGKLINGTSTDSTGNKATYTERITTPAFPGGIEAFYSFLANNVGYPEDDRENFRQGKVILSFIVSKSGEVQKIKILSSGTPAMNAEAIRVIKLAKWVPGKAFGRISRFSYVAPIAFRLQ